MATRYTMAGTVAGVTAAVVAALVAMSGSERAQSLGLTQHGALITAQDAGAADAVAAVAVSPGTVGQVLTVGDAGLPVWRAASSGGASVTSGVDTSRPTCTTGNISAAYVATDTGTTYDCESDGAGGARWRVRSTGHLDSVALRVNSFTASHTALTARPAPTTATIVVYASISTTPTAISQFGTGNYSSGFQLEIGNNASDRRELSVYRDGVTPARAALGVSWSGSSVRGLALRMTASELRWSLDGGAVGSAAHTGTPSGSGLPWIGAPWAFHAQNVVAVRWLAEAASDADLQTLSGSAAVTARRIPAVASATTILLDWHASRVPTGAQGSRIAGSYADTLVSTAAGAVVPQ